jgi:Stress responsive A/B Barrel Domain
MLSPEKILNLEIPMVKHIVMFKLAQNTQENLDSTINALNGMKGKIETLRFLEVGKNFTASERSYDLVLTTHFDDKEGLETYANHESHLPVIKLIKSLCSQSVVVDYEIK